MSFYTCLGYFDINVSFSLSYILWIIVEVGFTDSILSVQPSSVSFSVSVDISEFVINVFYNDTCREVFDGLVKNLAKLLISLFAFYSFTDVA